MKENKENHEMYSFYIDDGDNIISTHRLERFARETARKLSLKNPDTTYYVNKDVKGMSGDVFTKTISHYHKGVRII